MKRKSLCRLATILIVVVFAFAFCIGCNISDKDPNLSHSNEEYDELKEDLESVKEELDNLKAELVSTKSVFYDLEYVYKKGWITKEDLKNIAYYFDRRFYDEGEKSGIKICNSEGKVEEVEYEPTIPEPVMSKELEENIKKAGVEYRRHHYDEYDYESDGSDLTLRDVDVWGYYGTYHGYSVVGVDLESYGSCFIDAVLEYLIDGIVLEYTLPYFPVVWKNFYDTSDFEDIQVEYAHYYRNFLNKEGIVLINTSNEFKDHVNEQSMINSSILDHYYESYDDEYFEKYSLILVTLNNENGIVIRNTVRRGDKIDLMLENGGVDYISSWKTIAITVKKGQIAPDERIEINMMKGFDEDAYLRR